MYKSETKRKVERALDDYRQALANIVSEIKNRDNIDDIVKKNMLNDVPLVGLAQYIGNAYSDMGVKPDQSPFSQTRETLIEWILS